MGKRAADQDNFGLPQYVGYAHVQKALGGKSRRTVERMVKKGLFPPPVQLTPNTVGWELQIVLEWFDLRRKGLAAKAVSNPEDLEPDEIIDSIRDLAAAVISKRDGEAVDRETMGINLKITRPITQQQFEAAEKREFELYSERFANLDEMRSFLLAAWLFSNLRPFLRTYDEGADQLMDDPERIRGLGEAALHDDDWAELLARQKNSD